ncbi:phage holin family protein [Hymenobacter sp. UYCo722]|uniref:phage holin family protein n=1 Tax=Hymenobacter sp. UYCo722 TaxID=3156335 RepID=UPI003399284B
MFSDDDSSKTPRNDSLIGNLTGYLDTRIDLVRLELQQKASSVLVSAVHGAALAMLGLLFIIFVSIFAGLALNSALDSSYWGFGIVAGVYLVLLVLVLVGVDKAAFQGIANKALKDTIYKSDKRQA